MLQEENTMRTLLMVLMIAGLMSTVGVYAASLGSSSTGTIGGTGDLSVSAPTSAGVTVAWTTDTNGDVTGADVTWTPAVSLIYTIRVTAKDSSLVTLNSGTFTLGAVSGVVSRTDSVVLAATASDLIANAEINIYE